MDEKEFKKDIWCEMCTNEQTCVEKDKFLESDDTTCPQFK